MSEWAVVTLGSIPLDVENPAVGRDVELVGAVIGAALEFEEAGGSALLQVGVLEDKAGDLGFGCGKDVRRDFVFRDVVVEVVAVISIARRDGAWLRGAGGEERCGGGSKQEAGGFFHGWLSEMDNRI